MEAEGLEMIKKLTEERNIFEKEARELRFGIAQWESKVRHMNREIEEAKATLRDQFAMAALTGILACFREFGEEVDHTISGRARMAYKYADATLKERG